MLLFFTSRHYYFFEKLKIVQKNLSKLNCSYGKVLHTLKIRNILLNNNLLMRGATINLHLKIIFTPIKYLRFKKFLWFHFFFTEIKNTEQES